MELLEEDLGSERYEQARGRITFGLGRESSVDNALVADIRELTDQINSLQG